MNRLKRLNDPFDDGACQRCGECCMVITLETISAEEMEKLGRDFCYPVKDDDRPGRWGIRKVYRDWQPDWATEGVCVFLYPDEEHEGKYICKVREERPDMCRAFRCVSKRWAAILDFQTEAFKLEWEWPLLSEDERRRREKEFDNFVYEKERSVRRIERIKLRRQGIYDDTYSAISDPVCASTDTNEA